MAIINVKKPFIHNTPAGHVHYVPGLVDVPDEVANHWYVKSHSDMVENAELQPQGKGADILSRDAEIAAAMAAFDEYEPDLPSGPVKDQPKRRGQRPKV